MSSFLYTVNKNYSISGWGSVGEISESSKNKANPSQTAKLEWLGLSLAKQKLEKKHSVTWFLNRFHYYKFSNHMKYGK